MYTWWCCCLYLLCYLTFSSVLTGPHQHHSCQDRWAVRTELLIWTELHSKNCDTEGPVQLYEQTELQMLHVFRTSRLQTWYFSLVHVWTQSPQMNERQVKVIYLLTHLCDQYILLILTLYWLIWRWHLGREDQWVSYTLRRWWRSIQHVLDLLTSDLLSSLRVNMKQINCICWIRTRSRHPCRTGPDDPDTSFDSEPAPSLWEAVWTCVQTRPFKIETDKK